LHSGSKKDHKRIFTLFFTTKLKFSFAVFLLKGGVFDNYCLQNQDLFIVGFVFLGCVTARAFARARGCIGTTDAFFTRFLRFN